jgi:Double zinc ribbon
MRCPRCRQENRPEAKFCKECAAPLARTCPNCGTQASPSAKLCSECAQPLSTPAAPQPRFAAPDTYTAKHVAERILTSKAALEGERKQVTVLFADLKGSMEILADRDPEEARRILDPVLELMMEAVHRYEGPSTRSWVTAPWLWFGAPLAHEDHAVRACHAALRMQDSVKALRGRCPAHARRSRSHPSRTVRRKPSAFTSSSCAASSSSVCARSLVTR